MALSRYRLRIGISIVLIVVLAPIAYEVSASEREVWSDCQHLVMSSGVEGFDECWRAMQAFEASGSLASKSSPEPVERRQVPSEFFADPLLMQRERDSLVEDDRDELLGDLRAGRELDSEVIVEFEARDVDRAALRRAFDAGRPRLGEEQLAFKRAEYASIRERALARVPGVEVSREYRNLPAAAIRIRSENQLEDLLASPDVRAVHRNGSFQQAVFVSLPFVGRTVDNFTSVAHGGHGTAVAVLDTGVDYTVQFLDCTAPGVPATCPIVAVHEAAPNDSMLDASPISHGTNVSAIVRHFAGDTDILVSDVFTGVDAFWTDVMDGIDWVIDNQATHNIVAMNLSMYTFGQHVPGSCPGHVLATHFALALAAGIQPIVSAGNDATVNGSFQDGISPPACIPGAVSVGAVFDASSSSAFNWQGHTSTYNCTSSAPTPDQVMCFSQTSDGLSILAPGASVFGGGVALSGTSQAAPHVAGAWAVLSAVAPAGATSHLQVLQDLGVPVVDSRPAGSRTTERIFLPEPSTAIGIQLGILTFALGVRWSKRPVRGERTH